MSGRADQRPLIGRDEAITPPWPLHRWPGVVPAEDTAPRRAATITSGDGNSRKSHGGRGVARHNARSQQSPNDIRNPHCSRSFLGQAALREDDGVTLPGWLVRPSERKLKFALLTLGPVLLSVGIGACGASRHASRVSADSPVHIHSGESFPSQGVTLTRAGASARRLADRDGVPTGSSAIRAMKQNKATQIFAFGASPRSATLATVTERFPIIKSIRPGSSYEAWVIANRGPAINTGGPYKPGGSQTTTTQTRIAANACLDVVIYDLNNREWSGQLQNCKPRKLSDGRRRSGDGLAAPR